MATISLTVRASSLPRLSQCPAAAVPTLLPMTTNSPESRLGSAVHEVLSWWIVAGVDVEGLVEPAAVRWSVDAEEVEQLCRTGWGYWQHNFAHLFRAPMVEQPLSCLGEMAEGQLLSLTGHPDVVSYTKDEVLILDWKTGFSDASYEEQLKGYAHLVLEHCPSTVQRASVCTVYLRHGTGDWQHYSRADLKEWFSHLCQHIGSEAYQPGPWCGYCPRASECPARHQHLRAAVSSMIAEVHDVWNNCLPGDRAFYLGKVYLRAKMVESLIALTLASIKVEVENAGGVLPVGGGQQLQLREQTRTEIDAAAALDYLRELLGDDLLAEAVTISKGDVERLVSRRTPLGQKKKAIKEVLAKLEERQALRKKTFTRLELSQVPAHLENSNGHSSSNNDKKLTPGCGETSNGETRVPDQD